MTKVETEARALDRRITAWLVASGLAFRALLLPASLAASAGMLGRATPAFVVVALVAGLANAALALLVCLGRRPAVLESTGFLAVDLCFAAALNILATLVLPSDTFLLTGRDVFWQYALGTVVVWTSLRGIRVGAAVWAGGAILEFVMIRINHADLTSTGVIQALGRIGWLLAGLIIPAVIMTFATKGTRFAVSESRQAGREAERSRALGDLRDTALQAFAQIADLTVDDSRSAQSRIDDARRIATDEIRRGIGTITAVDQTHRQSLDDGLRALTRQFRLRGLTVDVQIRSQSLRWALDADETEALLAAVREALNVLQHAGVDQSEVTVAARDHNTLEVEITDEGHGFDQATASRRFELENSVVRRIHDVGGSVVIQATRGRTSIRISVPAVLKHDEGSKRRRLTPVSIHRPTSLEEYALTWFVIPALIYRACLTPLQVTLAIASLPRYPSSLLLAAMSCVFLIDITLLIAARSDFVTKLFKLPQFMLADFAVAAMLNVWVAIDLAKGTVLLPGRQFLWGYMFGTVILWTALSAARAGTALRGVFVGVALVTLGIALEVLVIILNHDPLNTRDTLEAAAEVGKLATAFLITWLIAQLAKRGIRLAVRAGDQSGREMERAEDLNQLYKGARDDLTRITEIGDSETDEPALRLQRIQRVALQQMSTLDVYVKSDGRIQNSA